MTPLRRALTSEVRGGVLLLGGFVVLLILLSTTLEALHDDLYREARFWLALLASFGIVALLLAAGTFALYAQSVRHQVRKIGVRRALGASANDVLRRVMKDALILTGAGLGLGLAASWYLAQLLARQVVGVEGMNAGAVLGVVCLLLTSAAVASWIPARWAGRVDPVQALRSD